MVGHTRWHFALYSVTILIFVCAKWLGKQLMMLRGPQGRDIVEKATTSMTVVATWRVKDPFLLNLDESFYLNPESFRARARISSSSADENVSGGWGEGGRSWQ